MNSMWKHAKINNETANYQSSHCLNFYKNKDVEIESKKCSAYSLIRTKPNAKNLAVTSVKCNDMCNAKRNNMVKRDSIGK